MSIAAHLQPAPNLNVGKELQITAILLQQAAQSLLIAIPSPGQAARKVLDVRSAHW